MRSADFSVKGEKTMIVRFACPSCNKPLRAAEAKIGSRSRCPYCRTLFQVPCNGRFAMLLAVALDITEDRPGAVERMKKLIELLGIVRVPMPGLEKRTKCRGMTESMTT
jgi:hypothetical protein